MKENDKYNQLISAFYQKHKKVLDYIFNNKPDLRTDIMDKIYAELEKDTDIVMYAKTSKYISFYPKEWKYIECIKNTSQKWYNKNEMGLLIELKFVGKSKDDSEYLIIENYVVLGPIEKNRQQIIEYLKQEVPNIITKKTDNNEKWLSFLSNTKNLKGYALEYSVDDLNTKAEEIVKKIRKYIESTDFEKLTTALKKYKVNEIATAPNGASQ